MNSRTTEERLTKAYNDLDVARRQLDSMRDRYHFDTQAYKRRIKMLDDAVEETFQTSIKYMGLAVFSGIVTGAVIVGAVLTWVYSS